MDHNKAIKTKASERYLANEMAELERHLFEQHYFQCTECADDVRTGAIFADNAKAAFAAGPELSRAKEDDRETITVGDRSPWWQGWLRPSSLVPVAAALSMAFVTSYQTLVTVPALRRLAAPAVVTPAVLAQATRGELAVVKVGDPAGWVPVSVYLNGVQAGRDLAFELKRQDGTVVYSGSGPSPAPGAPLVLFLPAFHLRPAGEYELSFQEKGSGSQAGTLGRYRFEVK